MRNASQSTYQRPPLFLLGFLMVLFVPGVTAKDSYDISGFVGKSSTEAASKVAVKLLDGESGKVLDIVQTNFFGKYKFTKLKPGYYILQTGEVKREVMLKEKDLRIDIDLSSKDGRMRYGTVESLTGAISGAAAPGTEPGPNDPNLMHSIAGYYWGYQGSTESKLLLCPDGAFSDSSESGYSGRTSDQLGNQTGAWGAASQRASGGKWSIQGNTQQGTIHLVYANGKSSTLNYQIVDKGCYRFGGTTLCFKSAAQCR